MFHCSINFPKGDGAKRGTPFYSCIHLWHNVFIKAISALTTNSVLSTETPFSISEKSPVIKVIDKFKTLEHEVSSGKITIVGDNTFYIPNFYFDGKAPTAFFIVGKGDKVTIENATFVYLNGSTSPLPAFDGQSIKLSLPDGLTVQTIDWLAVWCVKYKQNLGYVFLNKIVYPYPPQTFNLKNIVKSGPVILVNKQTLFVPNFTYEGNHKNVHFWVGNGTEPSSDGIAIPDETGSTKSLHSYQGQNLNLELPVGINTDNIDYFGVWSIDEEISLGHVPIKGIAGVPEVSLQPSSSLDIVSLKLPKCCPFDSIITSNGCEARAFFLPFEPNIKIYEHNDTHFSNESLDFNTIRFQPYIFAPNCDSGKYALDEKSEEYAILKNSSLMIKGTVLTGIFSADNYCLDSIEDQNSSLEMKIFACVPEYKIQKAMFVAYVILTIISTFCFAVTFFLYYFWLKVEDIHRKCFTGYVFCMSIIFLTLTIVQISKIENSGCEVLGFFFQIFMIASFTLLGILCFDILIIIKYINEKKCEEKRKRWYLAVALGVPIVFLIISISRNLTPDVPNSFFKPQYLHNYCYFEAESQRTIIFYIPIGISIIASSVTLVLAKLKIVKNDRENQFNNFWIEKGETYKFMWRKHFIVYLTSLLWFIETLIHLYFANTSMLIAIDLVEASHGLLVLLLFVLNKETRTQILKKYTSLKRRRKPYNFEEECTKLEVNNSSI